MTEQDVSDHDRLICIDVKVTELKKQFSNHLSHHFRYSIMAWGVALSAIVGLIVIVIKVL